MKQALLLGVLSTQFLLLSAQFYQNIAPAQGVFHSYGFGIFGGGVSWADFDGDGDDDLSLSTQAGNDLAIYRNDGGSLTRVFLPGLNFSASSTQLLWADYDNDGDADLLVPSFDAPTRLFRNDGIAGFTEVGTEVGLPDRTLPIYAACWGDYNRDGWLDLYLAVRPESPSSDLRNYLLQSQQDGTFMDRTDIAGVSDAQKAPLAVNFVDLNGDLYPEIYLAQDKFYGNTLFQNTTLGTFTDVSVSSGTNLAMDGMGISAADYDNDGDLDMYVANSPPGNALFRNEGGMTFSNQAANLGLGHYGTCWGVNFFDADLDGLLDLYVSSENYANTLEAHSALYLQQSPGQFLTHHITGDSAISYGNAVGDLDGDGYY
ncbi:MAG: VCBS repeat-containing protein, partial [Bacteroidetes bacterium]